MVYEFSGQMRLNFPHSINGYVAREQQQPEKQKVPSSAHLKNWKIFHSQSPAGLRPLRTGYEKVNIKNFSKFKVFPLSFVKRHSLQHQFQFQQNARRPDAS